MRLNLPKAYCQLLCRLSILCALVTCHTLVHAETTLNKIVAIVNNAPITHLQLDRAIQTNIAQFKQHHQDVPDATTMRANTLKQLISEQLQLQFAKQHGITVTNEEYKRFTQQLAENNHTTPKQLIATLKKSGYSTQTAKQRLREQCLIVKIQHMVIQQKISIDDAQVAYIQKQHLQTQGPNTYQLSDLWVALPDDANPAQIAAATQRAKNLRQEAITHKQSLEKLAANQSTGSGIHWHDLGTRTAADIPTIFNDALHQLKLNQISQPIQAGNGIHLVQMMAKHTTGSLSKEQAYNVLYQRQFSEDLGSWINELHANAYIHTLSQ